MFSDSAATVDYGDFGPKLRCLRTRPPPSTTAILVQSYEVYELGRHRRLPRCWSKVTMFANSAATVDYEHFGPKLRCLRTRPPPSTTAILVQSYDVCELGRHRRLRRLSYKVTIFANSATTVNHRDFCAKLRSLRTPAPQSIINPLLYRYYIRIIRPRIRP